MGQIKLLLLITGFFIPQILTAQKLINTSGATLSGSQYIIEYSVGEISISTITANNQAISQGLLQPQVSATEDNCSVLSTAISIYPNPVSNVIYFTGISQYANSCQVFSSDGRIVKTSSLFNNKIDVSGLAKGVYFIRFLPACNGKYIVKKIIKI